MKKLILIVILATFIAGCIGTFSTLIKVKDNNGTQYSITVTKNDSEHSVNTSVSYKDKTYSCAVIHEVDADFDVLDLEFDFSSIDATGEVYVRYKSNSYTCSVKNVDIKKE